MADDDLDPDEELDEDGTPRWAAEEPTAMWDDSILADSGYTALAEHRKEKPREATGPATGRDVGGADDASVKLSAELTGGQRAVAPAPSRRGTGLSWAVTILAAIGVGVVVYTLVRLLR